MFMLIVCVFPLSTKHMYTRNNLTEMSRDLGARTTLCLILKLQSVCSFKPLWSWWMVQSSEMLRWLKHQSERSHKAVWVSPLPAKEEGASRQ